MGTSNKHKEAMLEWQCALFCLCILVDIVYVYVKQMLFQIGTF